MKKLVFILAGALSLNSMMANEVFQLSLTPDIALHNRNERIEGFSLSIWGENPQSGFALGFVNGATGESSGVSLGLVNYADSYAGLQWGWFNYSKSLNGVQLGFVNYADTTKGGVQVGFVNIMPKNVWFDKLPDELAPGMIFVNWHF